MASNHGRSKVRKFCIMSILHQSAETRLIWRSRPIDNYRNKVCDNDVFDADIFQTTFKNVNVWIFIKISLTFLPKSPIDNISVLLQVLAWRRPDDKSLSAPMMVLFTDAYMPQWVDVRQHRANITEIISNSVKRPPLLRTKPLPCL